MTTNIGFWEQVLDAPTRAYQELFDAEQKYLEENISSGIKVLDIGCGEGRNMKSIYKRTPFVYGIDHDQKAVDDATNNFHGMPTVKVFKADADALPFESETFDVVTFLMILPNLENTKESSVLESARVLKKDGYIILSTFSETAFDERMKIYNAVRVPIEKVEGTKVFFEKSLGANTSEQFSREELEILGSQAGLSLVDCQKVGNLAYMCKFRK